LRFHAKFIEKFADYIQFFVDYNSRRMDSEPSSEDSLFYLADEDAEEAVGIYDYLRRLYYHYGCDNEYSAIVIPLAYINRLQNTD
jgi:hypothetical protein